MSSDSGYSFCFTGPAEFSFSLIQAKEFVHFATWHTAMDQSGVVIIGYVQFIFPRTEESLAQSFRMFKWMKSVNDPMVYGRFLAPSVCCSAPQSVGTPRQKSYVMERGSFMLSSIKKKATDALSARLADRARKAVVKASVAFLQVPDVPL